MIGMGIVVQGEKATVFVGEMAGDIVSVLLDETIKAQEGCRALALDHVHRRIQNLINEMGVEFVYVKASALPLRKSRKKGVENEVGSPNMGLLTSAELRGVAIAAASASGNVRVVNQSVVSRTFGDRNVDAYIGSDDYWKAKLDKKIRKGTRRSALMFLAGVKANGDS